MKSHDNLTVVETMNYCKFYKDSGKPLIVCDMVKKTSKNVRKWKIDLWGKDENGNLFPVRVVCEFMNARGKAKASGATSVLEVRK